MPFMTNPYGNLYLNLCITHNIWSVQRPVYNVTRRSLGRSCRFTCPQPKEELGEFIVCCGLCALSQICICAVTMACLCCASVGAGCADPLPHATCAIPLPCMSSLVYVACLCSMTMTHQLLGGSYSSLLLSDRQLLLLNPQNTAVGLREAWEVCKVRSNIRKLVRSKSWKLFNLIN